MSRAVLKAVADDLILSNVPVYSHLEGFIGTNGKELKINFFMSKIFIEVQRHLVYLPGRN